MLFPAREVPPYAEPVTIEQVKVGETYFFLQFCDDDLLMPIMRPVVYVGAHHDTAYFQDIDSWQAGERYDPAKDDETNGERFSGQIDSFYTHQLGAIFEFEKALEGLLHCSLRRQKRGMF
jgi:hypothetical protein